MYIRCDGDVQRVGPPVPDGQATVLDLHLTGNYPVIDDWGSVRKLFLGIFRERLFKLRFDLFRVAASGEIAFDNEAYRSLETLICGLLRFAHRVTLVGFVLSSIEQGRARKANEYVDYHSQIQLKISRDTSEVQEKLCHVLAEVQNAVFVYMFFSSLIVILLGIPLYLLSKMLNFSGKSRQFSRVMESEVYRAESQQRRLAAV